MTNNNQSGHSVAKAVIPAAGLGTRLYPITKTIPKELLPVIDKPIIQYVVEEALAAGITQLLVVLSPDKEMIARHLGRWQRDLVRQADAEGETDAQVPDGDEAKAAELVTAEGISISFVYQYEQKGLGHAVLQAADWVGDDPFAVMLADNITMAPATNVMAQLLDVYGQSGASVIGLERVGRAKTASYGIVDITYENGRKWGSINDLVEKPEPENAPSDCAIASRYVFIPQIFDYLGRTPRGKKNEIQLTDAVRMMLTDYPVKGLEFAGRRLDIGNRFDYLKTIFTIAGEEKELRDTLTGFKDGS